MIKLIALDLDGTLLTPEGQITQKTKDAIAHARAQGVKVVLATGRSGQEAAAFAKEAGCDTMAAAVGGAILLDIENMYHIRRWDMPRESGRKALELCLNKEIELMIFAEDKILLDPFSKQSQLTTFPCEVFHREAIVTEDPLAYLEEHDMELTKIHADHNPAAYPLKECAALPGLELTSSSARDFEVMPAGAGKGRALALMGVLYSLALDEFAAVGDSENDLSMLRAVGYPVAMGNANQTVKDAAKFVTATNAEDGVAKAIYHILQRNEQEKAK